MLHAKRKYSFVEIIIYREFILSLRRIVERCQYANIGMSYYRVAKIVGVRVPQSPDFSFLTPRRLASKFLITQLDPREHPASGAKAREVQRE